MTILLFVPAFILFCIFELLSRRHHQGWDWRTSILMSSLAWGTILVGLTELLSLIQQLNQLSVALAWGVVLVSLLVLWAWLFRHAKSMRLNQGPVGHQIRKWVKEQNPGIWVIIGILTVQIIALVVVALSYAPNTYESVTYHLSRVMHWVQDQSLAIFATSNVREIYFPPFAEYIFLHQFILDGGDQSVNLTQIGAFILSFIGVSAVTKELGAKQHGQMAAALLCAGIPLGVLQATAARNDLILSVWLITLVYFGLRWCKQPDSWIWAAGSGLSLGLALLTKATGFLYALPIGLFIAAFVLKIGDIRKGIVRGGFVILLALTINAGHLSRNRAFYSDPVGAHQRVSNDKMSTAVFLSNTIRNVAMHVPMDCKPPLRFLNTPGQWLLARLESLHRLTGMDPTDPQTTWGFVDIFDRSVGCIYNEHFAGNALHSLLIFIAIPFLLFSNKYEKKAKWFGLVLIISFLLINLTLRWQVWGTHLQIPLFVLWTPVIALALSQVRWPYFSKIVALLAVILSFLWIYNNTMRPLSAVISGSVEPREAQYFDYRKVYYSDFKSMTDFIAQTNCEQVGLNISSLAFEYPLWNMLRDRGFEGEIQHIDVPNETLTFEDDLFVPCAIVTEGVYADYAENMEENFFGFFRVYLAWPEPIQ